MFKSTRNATTHFATCFVQLYGIKMRLPIERQDDKIKEKQMSKKFEELDFTDNFFFCKILMKNKNLCIELLELILQIKIKDIVYMAEQKPIEITSDARGVRLDVYVEDKDKTVYDIEMQPTMKRNLPKRSRYYQGMIDLNLIERGEDFNALKKSYVIFICLEDPFEEGSQNDFTRRIAEEVNKARIHEEWRVEYMSLLLRDQEMRAAGREEGLAEGRTAERIRVIRKKIEKNKTIEQIAEELEISVEEVKTYMSQICD